MQDPEAIVPVLRLRTALNSLVVGFRKAHPSDAPVFRTWMIVPLVATAYYACSLVGFFLTPPDTPISTFWPPNAILLSAFLLTTPRLWTAVLLGVVPAHFLVQLRMGIPLFSSLGWFFGNTGEALLGAVCMRAVCKERGFFESVRGMVIFLSFGVLLAPVTSSFLDSVSAIRLGTVQSYWLLWETRLTTNMLSNLAIVPILVSLGLNGLSWFHKATLRQYFEASALAICLILVSVTVFSGESGTLPAALTYAPLLLLLWSAARFGPVGLSSSLLGVALISSWNAVHNRGPFGAAYVADDMLSLHSLLIVFASPLMLVAALLTERVTSAKKVGNTRSMLIQVQEQEYHRIARQLHTDMVGQLTLMGLSVDELRGASNPYTRPLLDKLHDQIYNAGTALLRLSHKIHPFSVEYLGLAGALTRLCRDASIEHGIFVHCLAARVPPSIPLDVSLRIFRFAQLALQNLLERQVKTAIVELIVEAPRVLLRISDNGGGVEQLHSESAELFYMREQALSLGGTFDLMAASYDGTVVEVSVPIRRV